MVDVFRNFFKQIRAEVPSNTLKNKLRQKETSARDGAQKAL